VYYQFVTIEIDKTIEICELWAQTYPTEFTPHRILGFEYATKGRWERSLAEFHRAGELDPSQALPYSGQLLASLALGQFDNARSVYQAAKARGLDPGEITRSRYILAFLENDTSTMAQMLDLLEHQPGYEETATLETAQTQLYYGRVRESRTLVQPIVDIAAREKKTELVSQFESAMAVDDALLGFASRSEQRSDSLLQSGAELSGLQLAFAGNTGQALRFSTIIAKQGELDAFVNAIRLPELLATIELKRGSPVKAVELLVPVKRYEEGWADNYWAAYIRGQAYLALHQGQDAALEFQKILDHPGVVRNSLYAALARLYVARAYALQGDTGKARASYDSFLTLWKDADPDIPILIRAKAEFAKLH
jgi:tetratricopeptide (TPR) repeat protein